jgi:anti-anti-sigma factor
VPDEKVLSASTAGRAAALPPAFVCAWTSSGLDAAWVHLAGELDIATTPHLEQTLGDLRSEARLVVLDLRELAFIDSSGVHAIVDASSSAQQGGRRLVLLRGPSHVDRTFELTGSFEDVEIGDLDAVDPPVQVLLKLAEVPPRIPERDEQRRRPTATGALRALFARVGLNGGSGRRPARPDWLAGPELDSYTLTDGLPSQDHGPVTADG